jgi:DNA-directed RNA polymerase subunit RPC12/RpoP
MYNEPMNGHTRSRKEPHYWHQFGLTWEAYDKLLEEQDGRCGICGRTAEEAMSTLAPEYRRLVPDHNHKTMEMRGLLCPYCNSRLEFVETHLTGIVKYLKRYRRRHGARR